MKDLLHTRPWEVQESPIDLGYKVVLGWGKLPEDRDRLEYAEWWNNNGILCFQFESIKAIVNARQLVKPGVDWISFGPNDLEFDLEMHSHSPFKTVDECKEYVVEQLKETQVCIR